MTHPMWKFRHRGAPCRFYRLALGAGLIEAASHLLRAPAAHSFMSGITSPTTTTLGSLAWRPPRQWRPLPDPPSGSAATGSSSFSSTLVFSVTAFGASKTLSHRCDGGHERDP